MLKRDKGGITVIDNRIAVFSNGSNFFYYYFLRFISHVCDKFKKNISCAPMRAPKRPTPYSSASSNIRLTEPISLSILLKLLQKAAMANRFKLGYFRGGKHRKFEVEQEEL